MRSSISGRRGNVAVEAAFVLALLLLVCLGVFEFGWMFTKAQVVDAATREGVRVGTRRNADNADVRRAVAKVMEGAGLKASWYRVKLSPPNVFQLQAGDPFTVTVILEYDYASVVKSGIIPHPDVITRSTTMAKEGNVPYSP